MEHYNIEIHSKNEKNILYFSITSFFALILSGSLWYFYNVKQKNDIFISPVPDFLSISKNNQVRLLDLWFPFIQDTDEKGLDSSDITAKSAIVYDLNNDKTIFEKSSTKKLPMASLTKIMTAIIALENQKSDDRYYVSREDLVGENSMGLEEGEVLTREELLYGLMLPSGNDAAEVLSSNFPAGRNGFIEAMNKKAKSLNLKNTHFDNPSGLQGDGEQYTTIYDLLVITRYALDNFPMFEKIVSTAQYSIPATNTHKAYELFNETNLLTTYEGVKGVKTGYTPEAGLCLVTYLDFKGQKLIAIILNSENRRDEMIELLDYSLKALNIEPPEYKG